MTAIYQETNRKRKRKIDAQSKEQAIKILKKQGYIEPFDVSVTQHRPPTDRQLNYAKDLGITIPGGATLKDVSALIDRKLDYDGEPKQGLIEFATNRGFLFSMYIGKKELYNLIFRELDTKGRIAFHIFSVYRYLSDDRHANLDTSPHKNKFYAFADKMIQNKSFMNSLNRLEGQDLRFFGRLIVGNIEMDGTSTNTISYKTAVAYLKENNLIKENVSSVKRIKDTRIKSHYDKPKTDYDNSVVTILNKNNQHSQQSLWKGFKKRIFSFLKK